MSMLCGKTRGPHLTNKNQGTLCCCLICLPHKTQKLWSYFSDPRPKVQSKKESSGFLLNFCSQSYPIMKETGIQNKNQKWRENKYMSRMCSIKNSTVGPQTTSTYIQTPGLEAHWALINVINNVLKCTWDLFYSGIVRHAQMGMIVTKKEDFILIGSLKTGGMAQHTGPYR